MADLNATYTDAKIMYDFLEKEACKNISDISVLCEKRDFYRLFSKPQYQGDYHTAIFDFNLNQQARDMEMKLLKEDLVRAS
jgi:hypothetical protein